MESPRDDPAAPPVFTIVCASNNPAVLERFLLPSVRTQTVSHELRVVDTVARPYPSAAAALNAGAAGARGRYLLFVHNDVAWDSPDFLRDAAAHLDRLPRVGAAGVIGVSGEGRNQAARYRNAVLAGEPPGVLSGVPRTVPTTVQTADELLLIVPAAEFRAQSFDEETCGGWHLYAVDYCLSARRRGLEVYVLPLLVRHLSGGRVDAAYFRTLGAVVRKHRAANRWIYTTCDPWATFLPLWALRGGYHARVGWRAVKGAALRSLLSLPAPLLPQKWRLKKEARRAARVTA